MESRKIPRLELWRGRYRAYRHKYGRLRAFWRGIVLAELGLAYWIRDDEIELVQHLVTVEVVGVELHLDVTVGPKEEHLIERFGSTDPTKIMCECDCLCIAPVEKMGDVCPACGGGEHDGQ